ncbi:putative peptidoglycan-binding domain-containing protein [Campylobacter fetus]|uniref:putative peptidoglycan-binding domain-containing protein n=1 Tax=Campylobacter fetus TaxID=196 RepID=UPI00386A1FFF
MIFYEREFWDKMRLNGVESQIIADEIFCFGVNAGVKTAAKLAQKLAGVQPDGIIGIKTLSALNLVDEDKFSLQYDKLEIQHYESLVAKKSCKRCISKWLEKQSKRGVILAPRAKKITKKFIL